MAAPVLKLKLQHPIEPWQKLIHAEMRTHLETAQGMGISVVCAGCGRILERPFMQLDHLTPRAMGGENYITNRALICQPCNSVKSDTLTLKGLWRENKKSGWMQDRKRAEWAFDQARVCADGLSQA